MKRHVTILAICLVGRVEAGSAQDVIHRKNGGRQAARVISIDDKTLKAQVILAPGQPSATLTLPRSEVVRVDFAVPEEEGRLLKLGRTAAPEQITQAWLQKQALLGFPNSNAGAFGLIYAHQLLAIPKRAHETLALFERIAREDWNAARREEAARGRLQALIATGRAAEAVEQAKELAVKAEDPAALIEAKYVLGQAAAKALRELIDENPRWEEDANVRPERHRLYDEALDHFLFAHLFFGSEQDLAARGLWSAIELYRLSLEPDEAAELARDIIILYPQTTYASEARKYVTSVPPDADPP